MKLLVLTIFLFFVPQAYAEKVSIAVAANFFSTLKLLTLDYKKYSSDRLLISSASTGKHYAQIVNGAPFDILLAADQSYTKELEEQGKVVHDSRFVYAQGQLVLWGRDADRKLTENSLHPQSLKRLAIANPNTAPYGLAAKQTLEEYQLWTKMKAKIVKGENIGQAFQFVASGNAQLGFVALSQVKNPANPFNKQYYWQVPEEAYIPIKQEAALLTRAVNNNGAIKFLRYLKSEKAKIIIQKNGYL